MSLIDGPIVAQFYREIESTDKDGNPIKAASSFPISVRGRVVGTSPASDPAGREMVKFMCRDIPRGSYAIVYIGARAYDMVGDPVRRADGSVRTAHVTATLRPRSPEVA